MACTSRAVAVSTTAVRLTDADLKFGGEGAGAAFQNTGPDTVYVGGPDVTVATGFPLTAGQSLPVEVDTKDVPYGICDSGDTAAVRVFYTSVVG